MITFEAASLGGTWILARVLQVNTLINLLSPCFYKIDIVIHQCGPLSLSRRFDFHSIKPQEKEVSSFNPFEDS